MPAAPRQKGALRRPQEDRSLKATVIGRVYSGGKAGRRGLQGLLTPSLHSYFWWSTLFYLASFIAITLEMPKIHEFHCNVSPLESDGGKGCLECHDVLIFCDLEDACYRSALNATYQGFSKNPEDPHYSDLQLAAVDVEFLKAMATFNMATQTPVKTVQTLLAMELEVAEESIMWHCMVLKMALGQYEFPETTPDVWGVGENCPGSYGDVNYDNLCGGVPEERRLAPCDAAASEGAVGGCEQLGAQGAQRGRRLTGEPVEYQVSAWSKCQCMMRCMPGIQTRSLICPSEDCTGNPPDSLPCKCTHCARCDVELHLLVLWVTCLSQVVIAFLSFLAYLSSSTLSEDTLVKISWLRLLPGFVCKWLPPLVKYCVVANMLSLIVLTGKLHLVDILATDALLDATGDCRASSSLSNLYVVLVCLWVFQVLLSTLARRFARPPPWLLEPHRNSWFEGIRKLTRCFGP